MEQQKKLQKKILKIAIVFAIAFLALMIISNLAKITGWFSNVFLIVRSVVLGLVFAYLLNPFFRFFERKLFNRIRFFTLKRTLSLICTVLLLLLIVALLMLLILPKFIDSLITFAQNYNQYVSSAVHQINLFLEDINGFLAKITGNPSTISYFNEQMINEELFNSTSDSSWIDALSSMNFKPITGALASTFSSLIDLILALFLSIYLLASKEKRYAQVMKFRRAMFSPLTNDRITRACTIADRAFGGFVKGKAIDSLIVGILLYVLLLIFNVPYALLISAFLAVVNVIPMVGVLIGTIPTAVIVLLTDPGKILPFLVIIFFVQYLDNNVITPKILGNNMGISPLCVLISITVFGALWGLAGMFVAVPAVATLLALLEEITVARLQKKGHPSGVESYYANNAQIVFSPNSASTTDKSAQRISRTALVAQKKMERGEKLKLKERFSIITVKLTRKFKLYSEISDQSMIELSTQEIGRTAEIEAERYMSANSAMNSKKKNNKKKKQGSSDSKQNREEH